METLVFFVSFLFIAALISSPFLILVALTNYGIRKYKFLIYLALGIVVTSMIALGFGWWSHVSKGILLSHYGYDFEAMSDTDKYSGVSAENVARVEGLEAGMKGIGWPLRTMMTFSLYSPYILVAYLAAYLMQKSKKVANNSRTAA